MKIAVIENFKSTVTSSRSGGSWDYEYVTDYCYKYTFYSDQKNIGEKEYGIIYNFLNAHNKSYSEEGYGRREEYILYDYEKSNVLAKELNCQIFEVNISHKSLFEHIIERTCKIQNQDFANQLERRSSYTADIKEYDTLPVIKYRKLVKDQDYWEGINEWVGVRLDNDGNLCPSWSYNGLKVSTLIADLLIESYYHIIAVRGNKWGVIDMDGNFVVKYQQYHIIKVYEKFCVVEINGNSSCINYEGELLMPFTSQQYTILYDRYAEIIYDDLKLLYDLHKTKLVFVGKYDCIRHITDNIIIVRKINGTIEIFNHDSLKLNDKIIEDVTININNIVVAKIAEGWIIYDSNANIIFKDTERRFTAVQVTNDGYISLTEMNHNNYPIYGLADMNGDIIIPCYSDSPIKVFYDNEKLYYIQRKYKKSCICNSKGLVISSQYDHIRTGREGICIAFDGKFTEDYNGDISGENGVFYAISLDGHIKFTIRCQFLYSFRNGFATIKQDYRYGKVNTAGEIVIPPKYEDIGVVKCGLVAVRKYANWGYVDTCNNIIIGFNYSAAEDFNDGKAVVKDGGFYATINTKGELLSEWDRDPNYYGSSYDSIDEDTYIKDGLAEAFNGDPSNYWNID